MRRKHKISYLVQDMNYPGVWFSEGKWTRDRKDHWSSSHICFSMLTAFKHCNRINQLGGTGLITRFYYKKGVRFSREYWIKGFNPYTQVVKKDKERNNDC